MACQESVGGILACLSEQAVQGWLARLLSLNTQVCACATFLERMDRSSKENKR